MSPALRLLLVLAASPLVALASEPTEQYMLLSAEVDVGSDGQVVDVRLAPSTAPLLATRLDAVVRATRFEPIRVDGKPATVTTHVQYSTCIRAVDDQITIAMEYSSHGPGEATSRGVPTLSRALIREGDGSYDLHLLYSVSETGEATLDEVNWEALPSAARRSMKQALTRWIEKPKYLPERINGEPVATRVKLPLTISIRKLDRRKPHTMSVPATCERAREALGPTPSVPDSPLRLRQAGPVTSSR